jgi:hypothetical protein
LIVKQTALKFIQFSVFSAVLFANIHYEWTPNGYAASVVALLAAMLVTAILVMVAYLVGLLRRLAKSAVALVRDFLGKQAKPLSPRLRPDFPLADRGLGFQGRLERDATSKRALPPPGPLNLRLLNLRLLSWLSGFENHGIAPK